MPMGLDFQPGEECEQKPIDFWAIVDRKPLAATIAEIDFCLVDNTEIREAPWRGQTV